MTLPRVLPFTSDEDWRWRWVQGRGNPLHRVLSYESLDRGWVQLHGVQTVCGKAMKRTGMPGLPSRVGARRCRKCCRLLGIEQGNGAPFNSNMDEPGEVSW